MERGRWRKEEKSKQEENGRIEDNYVDTNLQCECV